MTLRVKKRSEIEQPKQDKSKSSSSVDGIPPKSIIAGRYGGWKDRYNLIEGTELTDRQRAVRVAKELRKKYGWRIKVREFGGKYYFYKLLERSS